MILLNGPKGCGKAVLVDLVSDTARQAGFDVVNGPVAQYERLLPATSFMAGSNGFQTFSGSAGQDVAAPGPDLSGEVLGAELPDPRQAAARPVLIALDDVAWDDPDVAHESRPAHAG